MREAFRDKETTLSYYAIVTCRNSEDTIKKALESLLSQTVKPAFIIVIDDGSKDNTPQILKEIQTHRPDIHIITNPDLGYDIGRVVSNWNLAIDLAHKISNPLPEYHLISTDDIIPEPQYAEKILVEMDKDPNLVIASGEYGSHLGTKTPHGAGRFVRNSFYTELYPVRMGYESYVLHLALIKQKKFKVIEEARFDHIRPLGANHKFREFGASMRTLGYNPLFVLGRFGIGFVTGKPIGRTGSFWMLYYYITFRPAKEGYYSMFDKETRKAISKSQLSRLRKIIVK